jgi:hypothetical protein
MNRIMPLLLVAAAALAQGQDKPRVFVNGKGTENVATNANSGGNRWFRSGRADSTIGAHDEGLEVTKNLQKECPGVIVTINQATADYTVMLDRESKQNRGLLRTNTQIQVANRVGDVLGSSATRTVGNASRDACQLIMSDWSEHGRIAAPVQSALPPVGQPVPLPVQYVPQAVSQPTVPATVTQAPAPVGSQETSQEEQVRADRNTVVDSAGPKVPAQGDSLGDAAKRNKQHQACLKLAADNPSITCK